MMAIRYFLAVIISLLAFQAGLSQQEISRKRTVHIVGSRTWYYEESDAGLQEWLGGDVMLRHDSTYLFCDTAYLFGLHVDAVGNTSIVQGDSLRIFADTLGYNSETGIAWLIGRVLLVNGDQELYTDRLRYDTRSRIATYEQGAWLARGDTRIFSINGTYDVSRRLVGFQDSVLVQSPEFRLKADSLGYDVELERTLFAGPTRIKLDQADLYCESGYYSLRDEIGLFKKNAQYADTVKQATADEIFYDRRTGSIRLIGKERAAEYREKDRLAIGDTLQYNERTGDFRIRGSAQLFDGEQALEADGIDYNTRTERFSTLGRSILKDGSQTLEADHVYNADTSDLVYVKGAVMLSDSLNKFDLRCDSAIFQKSRSYFSAMGRPPVLRFVMESDTLYLIADRIVSERMEDSTATRRLRAFPHVFIYKSDMQAVCDSVSYAIADSSFSLFKDPVIWTDSTQFSSDTLTMKLSENRIDSILLLRNALILKTVTRELHYDQIKGRNIYTKLQKGAPQHMVVSGNAQTVYYPKDDVGRFIGVNTSECSDMVILFSDRQIQDIFYLRTPKSEMKPMSDTNTQDIRLEGFRWRESERPASFEDMVGRWLLKQTSAEFEGDDGQ